MLSNCKPTRLRWSGAAALRRHRRHHQVVERRGCAGALRLDHCGFGSRCQLCSQDTLWLHFSVFFLSGHSSRRTAWRRLRARSDGEFRALHSRDDLFSFGTSSWSPRQKTLWSGPCRSALRVRRWTTLSLEKNGSHVRRHVCPARLPRHVSVLLCVLPGLPARALRNNSMTSYMASKKTMEVKPTHSIMTEFKNKASADKSDKTVKDLIWLFFSMRLS